jgi:hypothetical protein
VSTTRAPKLDSIGSATAYSMHRETGSYNIAVTTVGTYELEAQLGSGSSGTVWRAHRTGPVAQTVAIKRLRPGADRGELERLRREAVVLADLDHPHVIRVLEVIADGDGIAIAMQYAPGGSLADLLAERRRLEPGEVVAVAAPVADALASAHRRGVLHGDVKPANILFTSDGEPLLSDFGVARAAGRAVTAEHGVAGTAEHLAPELLDGVPADPRADVYALGTVCYEALAGRPPFTGATPLAILRAADRGDHPPLAAMPDVPPPLAMVVERAISRDPAARHETAADLARALRGAVPAADVRLPGPVAEPSGTGGGGTRQFGPRPSRPTPEAPRRRRWPLAVAGLALVAGLLAMYLLQDDRDEAADCPDVERPVVDESAQVVEGDTTGDGCTTMGVFRLDPATSQMVLEIRVDPGELRPRRYQLGLEGDILLLGDWNCDGIDTPALYRGSTGQIFYYDSWDENQIARPVPGTPGAEPTLADTDGDGCADIVLVRPA